MEEKWEIKEKRRNEKKTGEMEENREMEERKKGLSAV